MKAFKIKRGNDTYYRVELPQQLCTDGKRRSVTGKTKAEAVEKAQREMDRHRLGLERGAGDQTAGEFLEEFLRYYEKDGGVAPSTLHDYRYHVRAHIVPALGKTKLQDLDPKRIDAFMKGMLDRNLSQRTCQYAYAVIRRALQVAVDWKYIAANPASARMRAAKRSASSQLSKIRFLTQEESRQFVEAVRGDRFEPLYILAITTGMRQGEMLGLQWSDLDLDNGKLTIHRALHRTKRPKSEVDPEAWFTLRHPKTRGSRRTIEIPDVTVEALFQQRELQCRMQAAAGSSWQEQKLVFTTNVGTPVDTSNVLHDFQRLLKRSGFEKMRFYDLRHTHASLLIAVGVHPKKIAERLGHASIKLTMDLYGHLFEGSDRESATRMQKMFGSEPDNSDHGKLAVMPRKRKQA